MLGIRIADGQAVRGEIVDMDGTLYYYDTGNPTKAGLTELNGYYYFAGDYGKIAAGRYYVWKPNGIVPEDSYTFGEDGRMLGVKVVDGRIVTGEIVNTGEKLYYYNTGKAVQAGLVELDGYYYFVGDYGEVAVGNSYVWRPNGIVSEGSYRFAEDGRMLGVKVVDGVQIAGEIVTVDGELYYYENGKGVQAGIIYRDGYYYFAGDYGKLVVNQRYYVWKTNDLLIETSYQFDEYGRIIG